MMLQPFTWNGNTGQKLSPGQAKVLREMALQRSNQPTPTNLGQGLASIGDALVAVSANGRADTAESEAQRVVAQAIKEQRYGDVLADPWADPSQQNFAASMMERGYQLDDRASLWAREDALRAEPDWQTTEANNGDILRYDQNDPNAQPSVWYDAPAGGAGATDFATTPIWGQFANGEWGYGVQGSDGQFYPVDTGDFVPADPRTLYTERAAGSKIGAGEGNRTLEAPVAAANVVQLDAKTDHVMDVIDKAIGQVAWDSTGMVGQVMGALGGTKAYDLRKTAGTVKANLGFAELQAMRDSSPTGGALGSIAVQELESLQSTLESLDPNQSEDQLRANLETIKTLLERQKQFRTQSYEAKYGPYDGAAPTTPGSVPSVTGEVTAIETEEQYGALPSGARYIAPDGTVRTKP